MAGMQFTRKKENNQSEGPKKSSLNIKWGRIFLGFTLALVVMFIIGYGVVQCKGYIERIQANLPEIRFAIDKPNLVKAMRVQYEVRQQRLEAEFTQSEKSSQDKLIEEVVGRLHEESTPAPTAVQARGVSK
jgi:hypothetical protein